MSTESAPRRDDLLELIQSDPEEAIRNYPEALRDMRATTDSERVKTLIDYCLETYAGGGGV